MAAALDAGQYSLKEIEKYEAVYGRNFISPGGIDSAREFTALLDLRPGLRVLDVGCGIGGGALWMAGQYGVQVHGIDLSSNMLSVARQRIHEAGLQDQISFEHGDILAFAPTTPFDRIYSRDVFLHIHDKPRLLAVLFAGLKPGGKLLFTDYCRSEDRPSAEFAAYIAQRGYHLCTVADYASLLQSAGFSAITAEDRTAEFGTILQRELSNLPVDQFDPPTVVALQQSWQSKITRVAGGEQRWGLFMAQRPALA